MKPLFTVAPGESIFSIYMKGKPLNVAGRSAFSDAELPKMLAHVSKQKLVNDVRSLSPGEEIQLSPGMVLRKLSKEHAKEVLNFYKTAENVRELIATLRKAAKNNIFFDGSFEESLVSDKNR